MSSATGFCFNISRSVQNRALKRLVGTAPKHHRQRYLSIPTTTTTVYAIGEGWTGAMGTGRLDESVAGHNDHEGDMAADRPVVMYETKPDERLLSCAVGWGHTALVVENRGSISADDGTAGRSRSPSDPTVPLPSNSTTQLLMTGRPHEFASLLRLQRLPARFRQYAVHQTYQTVLAGSDNVYNNRSLHPVDLVGRAITYLAHVFRSTDNAALDWETARAQSCLVVPTPIALPSTITSTPTTTTTSNTGTIDAASPTSTRPPPYQQQPVHVACSAGVTAVTTRDGSIYTLGLNGLGQCGIGYTSNNVWTPTRVTGLSTEFATGPRATMPQHHAIQYAALGLQHGLCLNVQGEIFAWGKGERGQLGNDSIESESHTAVPIQKAVSLDELEFNRSAKPVYKTLGVISQVATGMIHSAALEEETNSVYIWGKNTLPLQSVDTNNRADSDGKVASDARLPVRLKGPPNNLKVLQIACGSHHTSMLLEDASVWAVGVTTDTKQPVHEPICLIEAGIIDLSTLTQFAAHMDRTTVVFAGQQVLQVHLWHEPENQSLAVFTPAWVDELLGGDSTIRIRGVHRSWLHTAIVTEKG